MNAASRWRKLARERRAETETLAPGRSAVNPEFWDARAKKFAQAVSGTATRDPFLARVRRDVTRSSTVLDVGAGSGRFSLALAPRVREVTAVDWSAAMLKLVAAQARRLGLANLTCVSGAWEDVEVAPADVTICSYVLPLAADPEVFLAKIDRLTRRRAFVYLNAVSAELLMDPFWRHFHGRPRRPAPTYLDAVGILRDLKRSATVEIVEIPVRARFTTVAAAVRAYADTLLLDDSPAVRKELRGLLEPWLVVGEGGKLRPPVRTLPAAILSWSPAGR